MTKRFRDFLFILFVFLFIIGTLLISIYASGYKFNLKLPLDFNRVLVKTGMLNLDSNPKGATIYINDKALLSDSWRPWSKNYKKTPSKLKNMIPGDYNLRVEKEGYWPFKATVRVNSGLTTFYEDVNLFKSDNPTIKSISDESIDNENIFLSPNNRYLFLKKSKLLVDLEKDKETSLEKIEDDKLFSNNVWLKSNNLLIDGKIINPKSESETKDFKSLIGENIFNLRFNDAENTLYYQNEKNLSLINTKNNISEPVIYNTDIIDYLPGDNNVFLLLKDGDKVFVRNYSLSSLSYTEELLLSKDGDYSFQESYKNNLVIYDKKNRSIYFLDKGAITKGFKKVNDVKDWVQTSDGLIFISDWELKWYNLQHGQSGLLTRFSFELEHVKINEAKKYLILIGNQEVVVYDLKSGFNTSILKAEEINSPALDKSNNFLYFWGKVEDQQGVYRISIK